MFSFIKPRNAAMATGLVLTKESGQWLLFKPDLFPGTAVCRAGIEPLGAVNSLSQV